MEIKSLNKMSGYHIYNINIFIIKWLIYLRNSMENDSEYRHLNRATCITLVKKLILVVKYFCKL